MMMITMMVMMMSSRVIRVGVKVVGCQLDVIRNGQSECICINVWVGWGINKPQEVFRVASDCRK